MYHLAQINIARLKAPIDDPMIAGFVNRLDEINSLGENSPGFVWRLKDDDNGNATEIQVFDDPMLIVNFTVWKDVPSLKHFTYKTAHTEVLKQRKLWFHALDRPAYVLWWIPAGTTPTLAEAKAKLEHIKTNGATKEAFDFKTTFAPPTAD